MLQINPKDIPISKLHQYLLGAVGPRPIALASTIDKDGNSNLSPFSFFNVFSANPPIAIFSPARRVRNNTTKHTLDNIFENNEVVINVVSYDIVQQTSLSSTEYDCKVDEFIKSGLTPINSNLIKPFRVKESPVQMECTVNDVISLGKQGGAGNLVICEIKMLHINKNILNDAGAIDPNKIDLVGRMGGNWYCRSSKDALFEVEKPLRNLGIGVDNIPSEIRNSHILSGNDLGMLGNVESIPSLDEVEKYMKENYNTEQIQDFSIRNKEAVQELHSHAKELLSKNLIIEAWKILLIDKLNRK
ncbi:MAG: flavin reductase [Flavobacteriales bacterium]|nr:flavin reductase [Flavobacteriales bacterium]|tara:strand:+ start:361 stop:1266 length:906 start_codon:yes stop_codon:yes gene_type:complete